MGVEKSGSTFVGSPCAAAIEASHSTKAFLEDTII
jgi:hypothetical protein